VHLTRAALREAKVANNLHVVDSGEAALQFLRHGSGYEHAVRPDLVLLDLNLPRRSGTEVLGDIKSDPELRRIPVVVLTSSEAETDIVRSYDRHANCYIAKPIGLDSFYEVIRSIEDFWLAIVKLPTDAP
jgi:CheY-like chemotaxis protein